MPFMKKYHAFLFRNKKASGELSPKLHKINSGTKQKYNLIEWCLAKHNTKMTLKLIL